MSTRVATTSGAVHRFRGPLWIGDALSGDAKSSVMTVLRAVITLYLYV
jgi:hypothetical protein